MTTNWDSPADKINSDISARLSSPFINNKSPFNPELFINEPKSKVQAAIQASRSEMQVIDACKVMTKVNQRHLKRLKYKKKKNLGKIVPSNKAESIVMEFDIRSRSTNGQAIGYAASVMTFMPPQKEKDKKDINEL
jgi:hypothetical protein|tara:strand:+ start:493 stop:900 length:408 start_codon:yes stop_codon:yes gene_type:complete